MTNEAEKIVNFIRQTYAEQGIKTAVIAVSGGIDSGLSLTLLTKALGAENVHVLFLPYGEQSTEDGEIVAEFNQIPLKNRFTVNIKPIVNATVKASGLNDDDQVRLGNLMARARMMVVYDFAKLIGALVCGTENKSEKHLGYFTRFGDAASDLDPIQHLYKTQVRAMARELNLPQEILEKAPSAGLWQDQTDEQELGFSYEVADQVLAQLIDEQKSPAEILVNGVDVEIIKKIITRVQQNAFKQQVPYVYTEKL